MSTTRKPRGDAVLKTLPADRQIEIAEHAREHKLRETVSWLKDDGMEVSQDQVSKFLRWWLLQQQLLQNESTVESLLENLKREQPGITPEELDSAGQLYFTALSIEQKDSLGWKRAQDVKIKNRALSALERKIKLLEQQAEKAGTAKGILENKELTEEQKKSRMHELFGIA